VKRDTRLRDTIKDEGLKDQLDELWEKAEAFHDAIEQRQAEDGRPSDNGRAHSLRVEHYMCEICEQVSLADKLCDYERLLLSAAACCHDFGRALPEERLRSEYGGTHGNASADKVPELIASLGASEGIDSRAVRLLEELVSFHDWERSRRALADKLVRDVRSITIDGQELHLNRMTLLLVLADELDMTMDRVRDGVIDTWRREETDETTQARSQTWGVRVEENMLYASARAPDEERRTLVHDALYSINNETLRPLEPLLKGCGLPCELFPKVETEPIPRGALGGEERDAQSPTENQATHVMERGPDFDRLRRLRAATLGVSLARKTPDETAVQSAGAQELAFGSLPYWFLSSMGDPGWLDAVAPRLHEIACSADANLVRGLAMSLERLGREHPEAVLSSSLVQALWNGETELHRHRALLILRSTNGWRTAVGSWILGRIAQDGPRLVSVASSGLLDFCRADPANGPLCLGWLLTWYNDSQIRDASQAFGLGVDWFLGKLLEAAPTDGLRRAVEIAEADLRGETDDDRAVHDLTTTIMGRGLDRLFVKLRDLISRELREPSGPHTEGAATWAVRHLLASDRPGPRAVGLDVALQTWPTCCDLVGAALADARNYEHRMSELTHPLLLKAFARLSTDGREQVEETLLSIADDEESSEHIGVRRFQALTSVPESLRSERVKHEIDRIKLRGLRFAQHDGSPEDPHRDVSVTTSPIDEGWPSFEHATGSAEELVVAVKAYLGANGPHRIHGDEPVWRGLERALQAHPGLVEGVARAVGQWDRDTYLRVAPGIAGAIGEDTPNTVHTVLALVEHLPEDVGERVRNGWGYVLLKNLGDISFEEREEVRDLLAKWVLQASDPSPSDATDLSGELADNSIINEAINTTRGILVAGLMAVAQDSESLGAAEDAIRAVANSASPIIRAITLYHCDWLISKHYPLVIAVLKDALAGPVPEAFCLSPGIMRRLKPEDVTAVGIPILRSYLNSGHDAVERTCGIIVGLWTLICPSGEVNKLVEELLSHGTDTARRELAHVASQNTLVEDSAVRERARNLCGHLLQGDDAAVRSGLLDGLPISEDDLTPIEAMIEDTAETKHPEALTALATVLECENDVAKPVVTRAAVRGLLRHPLAMQSFLHLEFVEYGQFTAIYEQLRANGEHDLALRLLDAAAGECIEGARPYIEKYAEEPPENENQGS